MKKVLILLMAMMAIGCTQKEYIYKPIKGIDPKLRDLHTFKFDYQVIDVGGGDYNVTMRYWDAKRIASKMKRCLANVEKCKACCEGYRKQTEK